MPPLLPSRLAGFRWLLRWSRVSHFTTPAGGLLITGVALTAAFGVDTRLSQAYQFFALLLSLALAALTASLVNRPRLFPRRELPPFATLGEPLRYDIHITNPGNRSWHGLVVRELLADPVITPEELAGSRDPEDVHRNWYDRRVGFQRFIGLVRRRRGLVVEPAALEALPARGEARVTLVATPLRRGRVRLERIAILHPEPLGLFLGRRVHRQIGELLVLPRRHPIPPWMRVAGKRRYQQGGVALTRSVGDSEEFIGLREYREGDPPRRIHWPSWAKTGKPVVREYQEEFFVRNALVLDTGGHGGEEVFEEAVSLAAGFVGEETGGEALLDLLLAGPAPQRHTFGRGVAHGDQMLELLAAVTTHPEQPFEQLTQLVLEHAPQLSGCILVLTDWDGLRRELVARLLALEVPLRVLLVHGAGTPAPRDPGPLVHLPGAFIPLEAGRIVQDLARATP